MPRKKQVNLARTLHGLLKPTGSAVGMGIALVVFWMHQIMLQMNLPGSLIQEGLIESFQFSSNADRYVVSTFLVVKTENAKSADVDPFTLHGEYAAKKQGMVVVSIQDKNGTGKAFLQGTHQLQVRLAPL